MTDVEVQRLKSDSKRLFGQELRLLVMLAIIDHGDKAFTLTDLQHDLRVDFASQIQKPLTDLVASGLVEPEEPEAGSRFRPYRRVRSAVWDFAEERLGVAQAEAAAQTPAAPVSSLSERRRSVK